MTGNQLAGMETENRGGNLTCLCEAGKATLTPVNKNVIHCKKKQKTKTQFCLKLC